MFFAGLLAVAIGAAFAWGFLFLGEPDGPPQLRSARTCTDPGPFAEEECSTTDYNY